MKKNIFQTGVLFIIYLLPFLFLVFIWNKLPQEIPIHYNSSGNVTDYGPKLDFTILMLALNFLLFLMTAFIKKSIATKITLMTVFSIVPFIAYISALNPSFNLTRVITGLISILLIIAGLKFRFNPPKRNALFGIRTPLTRKNDKNWKIAHELGGLLLVVGGVILLFVSILISLHFLNYTFIIGAITLLVITLVITHYRIYRGS